MTQAGGDVDFDYRSLFRHRFYVRVVFIFGSVMFLLYYLPRFFVTVDYYAPEGVFAHYDYHLGAWIRKGNLTHEEARSIVAIEIYAREGKEAWPTSYELARLPLLFRSADSLEIQEILRMVRKDDSENPISGNQLGVYGMLFTASDQSQVYFPFHLHEKGVIFSFIREDSALVFGRSCIELWRYLKNKGVFSEQK